MKKNHYNGRQIGGKGMPDKKKKPSKPAEKKRDREPESHYMEE